MLTEEIVNEVKVLIGHEYTILVQQLIDLDEVEPTTGNETFYVGQLRGQRRTRSYKDT